MEDVHTSFRLDYDRANSSLIAFVLLAQIHLPSAVIGRERQSSQLESACFRRRISEFPWRNLESLKTAAHKKQIALLSPNYYNCSYLYYDCNNRSNAKFSRS